MHGDRPRGPSETVIFLLFLTGNNHLSQGRSQYPVEPETGSFASMGAREDPLVGQPLLCVPYNRQHPSRDGGVVPATCRVSHESNVKRDVGLPYSPATTSWQSVELSPPNSSSFAPLFISSQETLGAATCKTATVTLALTLTLGFQSMPSHHCRTRSGVLDMHVNNKHGLLLLTLTTEMTMMARARLVDRTPGVSASTSKTRQQGVGATISQATFCEHSMT